MKDMPTSLIRSKSQHDVLPRLAQQKRKQAKEKDEKVWPEEEKVARLYKEGKPNFKRFQSAEDLIKDLRS